MGDRSEHYAVPGQFEAYASIDAIAAAAATEEHVVFVVPPSAGDRGVKILQVNLIPQADHAGANTNHKNLNVKINNTERGNLDLTNGNNLVALTRETIYDSDNDEVRTLTGTQVVALSVQKVGNGKNLPQMLVEVVYKPA